VKENKLKFLLIFIYLLWKHFHFNLSKISNFIDPVVINLILYYFKVNYLKFMNMIVKFINNLKDWEYDFYDYFK
jgi:hypothetical protein